ncbi:MAG: hypothetical protein JRI22_20185 [Deltaproteobacteria bacterium]|nr:hypothetical protein [Deltaproteobacteria bacterium]
MSDELEPPQHVDYNPEDILDQVIGKKNDEFLPLEDCVLPSKGLYYDGAIPGGIIKVRPMGIYADKVLTTQRLVRTGQALDYIFKYCVELPGEFDPLELLAEDRYFLLFYLRGITHGNEYEFVLTCPYCDEHSSHYYNLNDLWETHQDPMADEDGTPILEPFKVVLPYLSDEFKHEFWVKIRFLRGRDVMDMLGANGTVEDAGLPRRARNRKRRRNKMPYDPIDERTEDLDETIEKNINRVIVEAMGSSDRNKIKQLIDRMHSRDTATITDFLREKSPGIDTAIETDCPHCRTVINTPLPITESFFRPQKRRRTRT